VKRASEWECRTSQQAARMMARSGRSDGQTTLQDTFVSSKKQQTANFQLNHLCTGQKFQREQEIIHFELNVKNDGAQVV
jgi:hypothetical protein